jgi:hypothetical protein
MPLFSMLLLLRGNLQDPTLSDLLGVEEINPVLAEVLQALLFIPFKQHICILSVNYTYNQWSGKERGLRKSPLITLSRELWQIDEGKTSPYLALSECCGHAFKACARAPWGLIGTRARPLPYKRPSLPN